MLCFPIVNPNTCIAWYPTRYDAHTLFGDKRRRTDESSFLKPAVIAIFAEEDTLSGATPDDAAKLKECLQADNRIKDHMVKVSLLGGKTSSQLTFILLMILVNSSHLDFSRAKAWFCSCWEVKSK